MNAHLKIASGIGAVGLLAIVGMLVIKPILLDSTQTATSDASNVKDTVTIAIDDWVGYIPLCSDYNIKRLRSQGIGLKCINDGANYEERMDKLRRHEIDMAVAEVGSYIIEGDNAKYPGVIVSVIDASNGGDAIVANKNVYPDLDTLKRDKGAKYALMTNSPSEFFGLTTGIHFGMSAMEDRNAWMSPQPSPQEVYRELMSGTSNVAVMWEPYVTKALKTGDFIKLVSTADAQNVVVDVLMANRLFAQEKKSIIVKILATYFKTLKYFSENPDKLDEEITEADPSLDVSDAKSLRAGVHWVNLAENCGYWFGCDDNDWQAEVNIVDTIEMALDVWTRYEEFDKFDSPLPDDDPYRLISSDFLKVLFEQGIDTVSGQQFAGNPLERDFAPLDADQWNNLKPFGQMKTEPILFKVGTNGFRFQGRQTLDDIVSNLKHYPNFRIKVEGHTSDRGNADTNLTLSQKRADAVKRYLTRTYSVDPDRILAVGFGGTKPLRLEPGQSPYNRAYQAKLARVEIHLLAEQY